jgi:mannose-6-phosphate isomerase-like protein (cupin superfamily)
LDEDRSGRLEKSYRGDRPMQFEEGIGMRVCSVVLAMVFGCSAVLAQDGGITVWPKGVPPGGIKEQADFGNHLLEISHREVNGKAELHKVKADVMVIQTGTATLVTGGEVIDPKDTGPNEVQGSGIKGGVKHEIGPGDVIHIPAGVPHQFLLAPGTQITYLVVKVVKQE